MIVFTYVDKFGVVYAAEASWIAWQIVLGQVPELMDVSWRTNQLEHDGLFQVEYIYVGY